MEIFVLGILERNMKTLQNFPIALCTGQRMKELIKWFTSKKPWGSYFKVRMIECRQCGGGKWEMEQEGLSGLGWGGGVDEGLWRRETNNKDLCKYLMEFY